MAGNPTYNAFLAVSGRYLITCAFTLAMMLRYCSEADMLQAGLQGRRQAGEGAAS